VYKTDARTIVLVEYGDYECPHCQEVYPILHELKERMGNRLAYVYRHFPISRQHPNAQLAAEAAEAAAVQGKFWEMHDRLYRNQKEWAELEDPRPVFLSYARQLNLNIDQFTNDLGSNIIDQKISADLQKGASMGVTGTPTVFLDSNLLRYEATNLDGLRRGINLLLEQKAGS